MKRKGDRADVAAVEPEKKKTKPEFQKDKSKPKSVKQNNPGKLKDKNNKSFKPKFKPKGKDGKMGKTGATGDTQKPPDWAKFKQEKKAIRSARREAGVEPDLLEAISKAKALSERLRRKKLTAEQKAALTSELHGLLSPEDRYRRLALSHDTGRIIQWMVKFGSESIREEAAAALGDAAVEMLQSKYARHIVKRMLKYGSARTRDLILDKLNGHAVKLASHSMSAPILDYAYSEIASKLQKLKMRQEFYGDIYKITKDEKVTKLSDTYKNSPDMKNAMLAATKANLLRVLNKNVHDCGLVHAVLFEYMSECNSADRSEMIAAVVPHVAPLSNTKAGVNAAAMCVWHGTNKDKKTVLKVLKEQGPSLAVHEHGHLLILAALTSIDDTVLVNKLLLSTLLKDVKSLAKEEWGRKVILWLVAHDDKTYFHPTFLEWLRNGMKNGTSKKPIEQRASEILQEALPPLSASISEDLEFWFGGGNLSLTAAAIIKAATGAHLESCLDSISAHICRTSWKVKHEDEELDGIEHPAIHLTLKKLAQHDKINSEKNEYTFGKSVCKILDQDTIELWTSTNRGCFMIIAIYENNSAEVQEQLKSLLNPVAKKLKKQTTPGAKILLKKLKE